MACQSVNFYDALNSEKSDGIAYNQGNLAKEKNLPVQLSPFPSLNVPLGHANMGK